MYEVSGNDLMIFVVLGFAAGVFMSFYLTRFLEVVHMHRIFRQLLAHMLIMCVGIIEDISFLKELKRKKMVDAKFTSAQIRDFEEVDDRTLTNWKNSAILSLVSAAPRPFRTMMPFNNWDEAVAYVQKELRNTRDRES